MGIVVNFQIFAMSHTISHNIIHLPPIHITIYDIMPAKTKEIKTGKTAAEKKKQKQENKVSSLI